MRNRAPGMTTENGSPSVQKLDVVRRLRRGLYRDRLDGAAIGLGAAMRRALRNDDKVALLDLHFLVAKPDRALAFEDVLDLVGVGMQMFWRAAVLDRDGGTIHRDERLVAHAAGVGGRYRVAFEFAGMDDLRGDGIGGKGGTQQMRDAATGGKGGGDRQSGSDAIHGWSSRFVVF